MFSQAVSTSVFRGVSDVDCLRQAEMDAAKVMALGYAPVSQSWSDDGSTRVLTVVYGYQGKSGATAADAQAAEAARDPWARARVGLGIAGAVLFAFAGFAMLSLKSQSGNSVAELFDNYVGLFSLGMAALTLLITLATRRDPPAA